MNALQVARTVRELMVDGARCLATLLLADQHLIAWC
jgi:hypothetical protein